MWLGYWPNSFLRSMDQKEIEFHRNAEKKKKEKGRRLKSPILTEQVWTTTWPKNRFNKNQE